MGGGRWLIEEMLGRGFSRLFPSVNRPEGRSLVSQVEAIARQKGY